MTTLTAPLAPRLNSTATAETQTDRMMDHLDKLDYAFLGFCVAGFLLCVIAMYRSTPSNAHGIRTTQKLRNSKATPATFPAAVLRDRLGELIGAAQREGVGSCEIANVLEAKAEVTRVAPTSP